MVRILTLSLAFACLVSTSVFAAETSTPGAGIDAVCSKVIEIGAKAGRNILQKSEASGHLQSTGRSRSCSLIYGTGNNSFPRQRTLKIYDSFGAPLPNSFFAYELGGCPFPARYYTGTRRSSCVALQSLLRRRQGNMEAYIKTGKDTCLHVKSLRGRQGAVVNSKPSCRKSGYHFYGEG